MCARMAKKESKELLLRMESRLMSFFNNNLMVCFTRLQAVSRAECSL